MSATTTATATTARKFLRRSRTAPPDPPSFRVLSWTTTLVALAVFALAVPQEAAALLERADELVIWAGLVAVADLFAVPLWRGLQLGMGLPLLLAAAFVYGPVAGGVIAFVGSADAREFRREISLGNALFNRSQVALSVMAAAWCFEVLGGPGKPLPLVFVPAMIALAADIFVNLSFVVAGLSLKFRIPARAVPGKLRFGSLLESCVTYCCFGFLAVLLQQIYVYVGPWGLAGSLVPLVLARRAFQSGRKLEETSQQLVTSQQILDELPSRIEQERKDERLRLASTLHDDVLQALYNVSLYAQVIREDLRWGRLLALEEDVPGLVAAGEGASGMLRQLIRDLRRSGPENLDVERTLRLLTQQLAQESEAEIECHIPELQADSSVLLVTYQVAREALVNATRHSCAGLIRIVISQEDDYLRLVVEDDGIGFEPRLSVSEAHFGLSLMRERAESVGGVVFIESEAGKGTRVLAKLPRVSE